MAIPYIARHGERQIAEHIADPAPFKPVLLPLALGKASSPVNEAVLGVPVHEVLEGGCICPAARGSVRGATVRGLAKHSLIQETVH